MPNSKRYVVMKLDCFFFLLFLWLGYAFLLGGCIEYHPKDIAVVSIKVVDYREQAEFQSGSIKGSLKPYDPYHDFLLALWEEKGEELVTPSDISVYFQQQKNNEFFKKTKPQKPIFKLEFTSKENLHRFARDNSYPVSNASYFCDHPGDDSFLVGGFRVYWRKLQVSFPLNYAMPQKDGERFTYYTFVNTTFIANAPSTFTSYDLRTDPKDVCFQLRGGIFWLGFASNVVVIPKAEIMKALENMPPALRQSPAK